MGFFTKRLITLAPLAIGGILAIFFLRNVATKGFQTAGTEFGTGIASLGSGLGTAFGSFGSGVGTLGGGIGEGISGLFKPIWELKNLADAFGLSSIEKLATIPNANVSSAIRNGSSSQRVSGSPRTSSGYTGTQQGSYVNRSGGVSSY
tara:strand:+ start:1415 stop:1858 length:444 start_codon:yes stop_codon:yes gene_type:complete